MPQPHATGKPRGASRETIAVMQEEVRILAPDGLPLAATLFAPGRGDASQPVVVLSATGVRRGFYARFAEFLAREGIPTLVFDYRGIGDSRPARLRGFQARMQDWAEKDAAAVLEFAAQRFATERLRVVGHSFGGQAVGLLPRPERIDAVLMVGAQSGHWRHWQGAARAGMWMLWHALVPGLTRLFGYLPSRRLGFGEDLPGGVARQWAAWGRRRRYILDGHSGASRSFPRVAARIRSLSFADDPLAPRAAADALAGFYTGARVERAHFTPRELGVAAVGHFGFFRDRFEDTLWREGAAWLRGA